MSYLKQTNYNAGDSISAAAVTALFTEFEDSIVNGTFTGNDIAKNAQLTNSQIEKTTFLIPVSFNINSTHTAYTSASSTKPLLFLPFYSASKFSASLVDGSYSFSDSGTRTSVVSVYWGYWENTSWVTVATIDATTTLDGTANNEGETTAETVTDISPGRHERPLGFGIFLTTKDAAFNNAATTFASYTFYLQIETQAL